MNKKEVSLVIKHCLHPNENPYKENIISRYLKMGEVLSSRRSSSSFLYDFVKVSDPYHEEQTFTFSGRRLNYD